MASVLDDMNPNATSVDRRHAHRGLVQGPIQQPEWLASAIETFGPEHHLERITVDDPVAGYASAVVMRAASDHFAPFVMPGVDELNEPMDLVYESPTALAMLAQKIVRRGLPLRLHRIRRDSPTIDALRTAVGSLGRVIVRPQANFPYIELNDAWLEPDSQLSSRRRSDFRRAMKRAQEYGDVRSEIIVPTLDDLDELLAIALDIEARSWKGEAGTALVHDPRRAEFFARYTRRACEQGILRMNFLYIGLDIAAMQIAVEQDAGLWLLKVGYDPEYARCSPGNLLIADTIRYAVDSGLKTYEFLGTSETWTRVWTEQEHETVSVRVYPASVSSAAVLLADACKVAASRLKQRFAR
jgi:hypothetical protein